MSLKELVSLLPNLKILLLDIEGTTTSISFVKDVLFPYARSNVRKYLKDNWENDKLQETVEKLRKLAAEDVKNKMEGSAMIPQLDDENKQEVQDMVMQNVFWQMDMDRKSLPLKELQGLMWLDGYKDGQLVGHVYEDVPISLERLILDGKKIYIYSSGSVQAQKLLFGHTEKGSLLPFISGHFDTNVGAKVEAKSYENIVRELGCSPEDILFLTDIPKEAKASKLAGLHACLLERPGNAPLSSEDRETFPVISSFADLFEQKGEL